MAYISDYGRETGDIYEYPAGEVLSHPSQTKTLEFQAVWSDCFLKNDLPVPNYGELRVCAGDPVVLVMNSSVSLRAHHEVLDGKIVAYTREFSPAGYDDFDFYSYFDATAIVGIALADAKYTKYEDSPVGMPIYLSDPIPVCVEGDVFVSIHAAKISARPDAQAGKYFAGEYVSARGEISGDRADWFTGARYLIGQILSPKTGGTGNARKYARHNKYHNDRGPNREKKYFHIPVRLQVGPILASPYVSATGVITATNKGDNVAIGTKVSLYYNLADNQWNFDGIWQDGKIANGITAEAINRNAAGTVQTSGLIRVVFNTILDSIRESPYASSTPFGAAVLASAASNTPNPVSNFYMPGMKITADFMPVTEGMAGSQLGTVVDVDPETNSIDVNLDPVATQAPTNLTGKVELDTTLIPEDTPYGAPLIRNPATGKLQLCRMATDNVDGFLSSVLKLPTVNGWTLEHYRTLYGNPNIWEDENGFWSALVQFGKGIAQTFVKPAVEWGVSALVAAAGTSLNPLGQFVVGAFATACGKLLKNLDTNSIQPNANGKYPYRTVFGTIAESDTPIVEVTIDTSGSYEDMHPNKYVLIETDCPAQTFPYQLWGGCVVCPAEGNYKAVLPKHQTGVITPTQGDYWIGLADFGVYTIGGKNYVPVLVRGFWQCPSDTPTSYTNSLYSWGSFYGIGIAFCMGNISAGKKTQVIGRLVETLPHATVPNQYLTTFSVEPYYLHGT